MRKLFIVFCLVVSLSAQGASTIDPTSNEGYGANVGWINAVSDGTHGAVIGQAFCSGSLYGANIGWINLGDGAPMNGMAYANDSAADYGVNQDGHGNLSGYAYGANIGWVVFEQVHGHPRVDLLTGALSGYVWGANIGWIHLDGITTLTLDRGPDTDDDSIPDAWEYGHTNSLLILGGGDADGDGVLDLGEYLADTDPFAFGDVLRITEFQTQESTNLVTWPVKTTRLYTLQYTAALSNGMGWTATGPSFIPAAGPNVTETVAGVSDTNRFYRVQAQPPLSP